MNPLLPFFFVSLLAAPTATMPPPPPIQAPLTAPVGPAAGAALDAASLRRVEVRLLHQALRPLDLGPSLQIWDPRAGEWLRTESSEAPSARVVVVYLWNPAAAPSVAELPWLRELARRVEKHHTGDVRFLLIAEGEGTGTQETRTFLANQRDRGGSFPHFLDPTGAIGEELRQALPGSELPMPLTLILDEQRVVRHVLVGSLAQRRSELIGAVSDLLLQIRRTRSRTP